MTLTLLEPLDGSVLFVGYTSSYVNQALERLGWRERIIDETWLEIIILLFENESHDEVEGHFSHKVHNPDAS